MADEMSVRLFLAFGWEAIETRTRDAIDPSSVRPFALGIAPTFWNQTE